MVQDDKSDLPRYLAPCLQAPAKKKKKKVDTICGEFHATY